MSNYRCCPICFRGGHEAPTNFPPREQRLKDGESMSLEQRFFRVFPRYLDMVGDSDDDGEFPLDKFTDLNLISCGECTKVMESFCELYHKMKTIELDLNWKISTLKNIMMSSKRVSKRGAIFEECVKRATKNHPGTEELDADKIISSVMKTKNMLIKNCRQKMTEGFPKIVIKKGACHAEQLANQILPKQLTGAYFEHSDPDETSLIQDENSDANKTASINEYDDGERDEQHEPSVDSSTVPSSDINDDNDNEEPNTSPPSISPRSTSNEMNNEAFNETSRVKTELEQRMDIDIGYTPLPDLGEVPIQSGDDKAERSIRLLRPSFRCLHCEKRFSLEEKLQLHITEAHKTAKGNNEVLTSSSSSESDEGEIDNDSDHMSLSSTSVSSTDIEEGFDRDFQLEESNLNLEIKVDITPKLTNEDKSVTTVPITAATKKSKNMSYKKKTYNNFRFRLKCPDCDELFKDFKSILLHRKDSNSCQGIYDPATTIRVEVRVRGKPRTVGFTITSAVIDLPQAIFVCEECQLPLYNAEHAEAHKKLHGKFSCNFCPVTKRYAPNLAIHELKHKSENKKIKGGKPALHLTAFCPRCDFQCSYWASDKYVRHYLQSHLSLAHNQPVCAICQTDFFHIKDLLSHLKNYHDLSKATAPVDIKRCPINDCSSYFLTSNQQTFHLQRYHNILKRRYGCQDCGKSYGSHHVLRKHRIQKHVSPMDVIPCPSSKCSMKFESKRDLDSHLSSKYHDNVQNPPNGELIPCPQCTKTFASQTAYKTHLKSHRRTPLVCDICGKVFKYKHALDIHYPHHKSPEEWEFECEICKKKCPSNWKLKEHMMIHTQERKNYVCQVCGMKYAFRHNLRLHMNNKHGDVVQDIPKKINTTNFKSRKGIKRWKPAEVAASSAAKNTNDVAFCNKL